MKKIVTASDIYSLNVDGRICIDLITLEKDSDAKGETITFTDAATGGWNLCRVNDEQIVLANACIFDEILNIELMSTNIDSYNGYNCMTHDEAESVKRELMQYKSQLDDSMTYMNTLESAGTKHTKAGFLRLTVNEDESPLITKEESTAIVSILNSPFGIANIAPIGSKTMFVKLFKEGTSVNVFRSFIGEIALIEFRMERQKQNFFDLFGAQGMPNILFHEE